MEYNDVFLARVEEIEKGLEKGCYFAALTLALTLPDICGKAEYPSKCVGDRYRDWYDEYVGKYEKSRNPYNFDMPYLSGEVVYKLRCSFLHSGNPSVAAEEIKDETCKVDCFKIRYGTSLSGDVSHVSYWYRNEELEPSYREYDMNLRVFCMKLSRVAKSFYLENKTKFNFFNYKLEKEDENLLNEDVTNELTI